MRDLAEALATPSARAFLEAHGVCDDPVAFLDRLRPPPGSSPPPGAATPVVYVGQQLSADLARPAVAKIETLVALAATGRVRPLLVWSDVDRSGSDRAITTISWDAAGGTRSVRMSSRRHGRAETRFVPCEPDLVHRGWDRLGAWLAQDTPTGVARAAALERHGRLRRALRGARSLADVDDVLTTAALASVGAEGFASRHVSDMLTDGALVARLERLVAALDDVAQVVDEAVDALTALGVDPRLRRSTPGRLPLFHSCPATGVRSRCHLVRDGTLRIAEAPCDLHGAHRFELGRSEVCLAALATGGRWSPDVSLPLLLAGSVSGVVAGRSSALYGVVLARVQSAVFGEPATPALVPAGLLSPPSGRPEHLLQAHLVGTAW